MLGCAFAGHGLLAMVSGVAVNIAERRYYRPRTRLMLAITLMTSLYYAL